MPAEIEKAVGKDGQEVMKWKGIASTTDEDSQSEIMDPSNFELRKTLWVNWNHAGSKDPATIVGETTKTSVTPDKHLYVEGILYPEVPMAKATWTLMKALSNSPTGNKLGISVEGKVIQRGCGPEFFDKEQTIRNPDFSEEKWNKILKARISGVALCPVPINGKTWADIMKGEIDDIETEEEFDEDTKKAMVVNVDINPESVEHKGKPKASLTKSEVYEHLLVKGTDKANIKSLYTLIEKISTMNKKPITDETIAKAFEILELSNATISNEEEIKKAEELAKAEAIAKAAQEDEDEDEDQKEMVTKACTFCKAMVTEGKSKDDIKAALVKKGYGESIINKAMDSIADANENKDGGKIAEEMIKKSFDDMNSLLKGATESTSKKLDAIGTILKSQQEEIGNLNEKLEEQTKINKGLQEEIQSFGNAPAQGRKSFTAKSYVDKFEKSEKGEKVFNIASPVDRKALGNFLEEQSGINKGTGEFDQDLMKGAQDLEISKSITGPLRNRLKGMGIEVVME